MQLDTRRVNQQIHNGTTWILCSVVELLKDGTVIGTYGSSAAAFAAMDAIWAKRSDSDRVMEALYTGR